jgi:protein MpaA
VHRAIRLGQSVRHRPIEATQTGVPGRPSILVVGCIHGNEPAGIAIARDLVTDRAPRRLLLWVVPDLNPDGVAAGTRQNAHGVDLNRNFPWDWRRIGRPGDLHYSGPHALSEPESRTARRLILSERPHVAIWFHQHADVVDESGGNVGIERRYAFLTHPAALMRRGPPGSCGSSTKLSKTLRDHMNLG